VPTNVTIAQTLGGITQAGTIGISQALTGAASGSATVSLNDASFFALNGVTAGGSTVSGAFSTSLHTYIDTVTGAGPFYYWVVSYNAAETKQTLTGPVGPIV